MLHKNSTSKANVHLIFSLHQNNIIAESHKNIDTHTAAESHKDYNHTLAKSHKNDKHTITEYHKNITIMIP